MRQHPFRTAFTSIVIGVISFAIAAGLPYFSNTGTYSATRDHLAWYLATLFWLVIPAVMLLTAICLIAYGVFRKPRTSPAR
jgi:hypothetical protein